MPWWRTSQPESSAVSSYSAGGGYTAAVFSASPTPATAWLKFDDCDSYSGQDAHWLRTQDIDSCKAHCDTQGYGGFVCHRGIAYFRQHSAVELQSARTRASGSTLYVRAPVVAATVALPITPTLPAAAAASTSTCGSAPQPSLGQVPLAPEQFPELEKLEEDYLQALQANLQSLEDWITEHPKAQDCHQYLKDIRAQNCRLSRLMLEKRKEIEQEEYLVSKSRFGVDLKRDAVRSLQREQAEALTRRRHAPQQLGQRLSGEAAAADAGAEALLEKALATEVTMGGAALAQFRQQYLEKKMEKHRKLALRERVLIE